MWDSFITTISALAGLAALLGSWLSWRKAELRKTEVLNWSAEVIRSLERLVLACPVKLDEQRARNLVTDIVFDTAELADRGRLFFRNQVRDGHGRDKAPAYRGQVLLVWFLFRGTVGPNRFGEDPLAMPASAERTAPAV